MVEPEDITIEVDEDEPGFIQVKDGEEVTLYSEDNDCYYCGKDVVAVAVAETMAGKVHGAMCRQHLDRLKQRSEYFEVKRF